MVTFPWSHSGLAFSPSAWSPLTSRTSFPTSDPELVPPPLQVVLAVLLQLLPLLKKLLKKKRKKNQRRNPMMTWDSDFSTKGPRFKSEDTAFLNHKKLLH